MGRSVLVTGGNRGLGLAIAQAFVTNGDSVAVTHRGTTCPPGLLGLRCDITEHGAMARAAAQARAAHGPVEVLVANAGIADDALLMGMREEQFDHVVTTNLGGAFRSAKHVVADMLRNRRGHLVFVSSVAGHRGFRGQANYAASKAGMLGLARSLACELGPWNITVNVVAPGLIDGGMTSELTEQRKQEILAEVPLERMGRPEEIAKTVLWLASPAAAYVTGALIPVDGGLGMGF